jgi:hypothetical protein
LRIDHFNKVFQFFLVSGIHFAVLA